MSIWLGLAAGVVMWLLVAADRRAEQKRFDAEREAFERLVGEMPGCGYID